MAPLPAESPAINPSLMFIAIGITLASLLALAVVVSLCFWTWKQHTTRRQRAIVLDIEQVPHAPVSVVEELEIVDPYTSSPLSAQETLLSPAHAGEDRVTPRRIAGLFDVDIENDIKISDLFTDFIPPSAAFDDLSAPSVGDNTTTNNEATPVQGAIPKPPIVEFIELTSFAHTPSLDADTYSPSDASSLDTPLLTPTCDPQVVAIITSSVSTSIPQIIVEDLEPHIPVPGGISPCINGECFNDDNQEDEYKSFFDSDSEDEEDSMVGRWKKRLSTPTFPRSLSFPARRSSPSASPIRPGKPRSASLSAIGHAKHIISYPSSSHTSSLARSPKPIPPSTTPTSSPKEKERLASRMGLKGLLVEVSQKARGKGLLGKKPIPMPREYAVGLSRRAWDP